MIDSSVQKITCSVCGVELRQKDKFCFNCGSAVGLEVLSNKKSKFVNGKNLGKKNKSSKIHGKNFIEKNESEPQKISVVKIVYILIALAAVVLILNYFGGVFETAPVSKVLQNNSNEVNQGADLQHLQQINSLEETIKNNPADKSSLLELAHLLNDSGFKDRAIEKYKLYLSMDPKNADVLVDMGVCYYELGKYDDAIHQMKEALKYQPKHQIAHLNLGIVNMTAGSHDEALKWLNKAVEIDPSTNIAKRAKELINSH